MSAATPVQSAVTCILAFDVSNRLAVRRSEATWTPAFSSDGLDEVTTQLDAALPAHTPPAEYFTAPVAGRDHRVFFVQATGACHDPLVTFRTIEELEAQPDRLAPALRELLPLIEPHLIDIPYLHIGENDFIYKFRPEKSRNTAIYAQDSASSGLYQSRLCAAIKALARQHERSATDPVPLDFGAVRYFIPSHFGFCLGVKNAIERAYETLAANPGRRVFMLSELIHNPFVNDDLRRRGLRYLQTDKGVPFTDEDRPAPAGGTAPRLWDTLTPEDIVIIPAFGATNEDKRRLIRKGIAVCQYDATCMLVEKVWKTARAYGRQGYTVIIHGKAEHEETKATFSNTRRYAPAIIVRDMDEAHALGHFIAAEDPAVRAMFYRAFAGRYTPGFDVNRHLERVAVVNQTTLLVNETRAIINYLRDLYAARYGPAGSERVGGTDRTDTLCYATQVNQDALNRALAQPLDGAFVIGGTNSSNTYQLFRLCEQALGPRAYFVQSEASISADRTVRHFVFPSPTHGRPKGETVSRPLWPDDGQPKRVLITGGASCPDGLVQQVITRLNALFPAGSLRPMNDVLTDIEASG